MEFKLTKFEKIPANVGVSISKGRLKCRLTSESLTSNVNSFISQQQ